MKKIISLIISVLVIFSAVGAVFSAQALFDSGSVTSELKSDIYYMENLDEGTVFFEKNSSKKTPAAAFIKILASIVALEKWGNLEGSVKVTKENLSLVGYDFGVRVANYKEGETVSKRELFDCLVVYGANDAASIIAYEISGSLDSFIAEMQAVSEKIGCSSTVAKNITGFDAEGQYTTALDVAKIIKYALNYPMFEEAFSAKTVTLKETDQNKERTFNNTNRMTNAAIPDYYHSSVTGGKQTSTDEAGECVAVISNKDGYSYITIVMGGKITNIDSDSADENTSMTDAKKMLSWAYDNIRYRAIVSPTQTVESVPIIAGKGTDTLRLVPEKETSALVPAKATPASVMFRIVEGTLPEKIVAPVKAGEIMAQAKVYYAGQELATINLVAGSDIKMSFTGLVMSGIKAVIGSTAFLIISLILAITAVVVFIFNFLEFQKKKNIDIIGAVNKLLPKEMKKKPQAKKVNKAQPKGRKSTAPSNTKTAPKGKGSLAAYQQRYKETEKKTDK